MNELFMKRAIELSVENVMQNGGPFGAVVVHNGVIVGTGVNRVVSNSDPTAHAEVIAIRDAARNLNTFDLHECEIYTSCEPCPMCLGAIYWSRIGRIYYGNSQTDAAGIGFDDQFIYEELALPLPQRKVAATRCLPHEAIRAFQLWDSKNDKVPY